MSEPEFHAACGICGGPIFMLTCHNATGSNHEWVLCSVCTACRNVYWTQDGCLDCAATPPASEDHE